MNKHTISPSNAIVDRIEQIFTKIKNERFVQDKKWGKQNHEDLFWNAILGEEMGEVSKSIIETGEVSEEELIQAAAVIIAWLECRERRLMETGE